MSKKILVVDDEPNIVKLLETKLKVNGYEVITAFDGQVAVDKAYQEKPNLIILDLKLPRLAGELVCKKIKTGKETKDIPIIMLTAKDSDVDRVIGRVIGADVYLTKPLKIEELLGIIRETIG